MVPIVTVSLKGCSPIIAGYLLSVNGDLISVWEMVRKELEEYCGLDTEGMVEIIQRVREVIG